MSKVYGDALFVAAKDLAAIDQAYEEVTALRDIFAENMDLRKILNSPKISREEKAQIIHTIFEHQVSDMLMGFLITVVNKGRQAEFERIFSYFISIVKEYKGIGVASVVSAMPLTKSQEEEIEKTVVIDKAYNDNEEKRGQPAAAGPEEVEEAKKALHEMGLRGRVVASGIRRAFQTLCRVGRSWHRGRC